MNKIRRESIALQGAPGLSASSGLEEGDRREDAAMVVAGLVEVQSGHDAADMLFDGALGDSQPTADAGVGPSLGHERQYLLFRAH
jgi:hypothetical protein